MSDQEIQTLESQFPARSGDVFAAARQRALDAGLSVLETQGDTLYRVAPDGKRRPIKKLDRPTAVVSGEKIKLW